MTRPGDRLRALARRCCTTSVMERLIDPAIADLQHEHDESIRHGLIWRSRWIQIAGYAACAKVAALAVTGDVLRTRIAADDRAVVRTLWFSLAAVALLTGILMWPPLGTFARLGANRPTTMVLCLVPQALALALPLGLVFGVLLGLRNRLVTAQLTRTIALFGIGCTVAAFVLVALLMPAANQSFRELIVEDGIPKPIARGYNELSLDELASSDLSRLGPTTGVDQKHLAFEFQFRLGLAFAPLALSLLALSVAASRRKHYGPIIASLVALTLSFGYYTLLYYAREVRLGEMAPAMVAGWTPNLLCFAAALLLLRRARLAPRPAS